MPEAAPQLCFMRKAIACAKTNLGRTAPNPVVGCVIVRENQIVALGVTGIGGRPHAEEMALDAAGHLAQGADIYVTLEPCFSRSNGSTSCSALLVEAKPARVIIACHDPSPHADHQGVNRLKAAGIAVVTGFESEAAEPLIAASRIWYAEARTLIEESLDGDGFDRRFEAVPHEDLCTLARLQAHGGPARLWVPQGSDLAHALRSLNLISD